MNHKKEFLVSLLFVGVLGTVSAYFLFDKEHPVGSIVFSYVGMFGMFFVPYLFKKVVKKKEKIK